MNQLSKSLMCISLRNGAEIWLEKEKMDTFQAWLETKKFIKIGESIINTADIVSILPAKDMEDITRRRNGEWKCTFGFWHEKFDQCAHRELLKYSKQ